MNEILLIGGMAAVTFAIRYTPMALAGRIELPPLLQRALRYVPVAVLTAIVIPAMLIPDGRSIHMALDNAYLGAGVISAIVAWFSKNLLLTIVVGMGVFFLWRWLMGT
jgi:branched-subunit amino acid transport protein